MSTLEPNPSGAGLLQNNIKYVFNLFNVPRPYPGSTVNTRTKRSPTPSLVSETSVEFSPSGHNMVSDAASSSSEESEELTNLTWLTELRNELLTWPDSVKPVVDDECSDSSKYTISITKAAMNVKASTAEDGTHVATQQQKRPSAVERYNTFLEKVKKDLIEYDIAADIYQTDVEEKPPFNYSHIIGMAMVENGRMTLQQICSWIESKFAFFRVRKRWNNSIRHNLSLHHCFKKIDRNKYEKGKGGFWELGIDPKKCDRKRIRNRKSSNKNRHSSSSSTSTPGTTAGTAGTGAGTAGTAGTDVKEHKKPKQMLSTSTNNRSVKPDSAQGFVMDELGVQQNIVNQEYLASIMMSSSSNHQTVAVDESGRMCPYDLNGSIKFQDVFIQNIEDMEKLPCPSNSSADSIELETVIVNSTPTGDVGVPSLSVCDIGHQVKVFTEDEIPEPCESVIISSYLSNESIIGDQSQPNVIVQQMEPYCTVSTAAAATSISETSFRPYIDGVDEAFLYLRNMDTRCDDLFDNLLDISVSDY